ncbi:hypothetical protein [Lysobacter enzymogenes]|uniref:hypothetical protein n=1 Tax=Lysobacter enzymogenes TaxID=69 RepID=UPI000895AB78|nr:hypothetical protein [Lysobacter enzymogenes]SDW94164.1 hypothetical protein SAMN05421681_103289 [Lysobacter enzymogenes]
MNRAELPPLEFVLTPADRDRAALATVHLEARRRALNDRDRRQQRDEDARELERALERP